MRKVLIIVVVAVVGFASYWFWKHRPSPIRYAPEVTITVPPGFTNKEIASRVASSTNVEAAAFIKAAAGAQGYLFPDTYRFYASTTAADVTRRMRDNFTEKVPKEATRDILIMASILEGEIKTDEEMRIVADILFRRLRAGWPLQVDAAPETYDRRGLPSEPINNPGLRAINAALHPSPNQFWFYLTGTDGRAHFARTLAEHNKNKKFLK